MSRLVSLSEGLLTTEAGSVAASALAAATDASVVHLAGIETITGAKTLSALTTTFSGGIISTSQAAVPTCPSPAAGFSAVSFSAASTDTAGAITFTVATPGATAAALPIIFNRTYAAAPKAIQLTLGANGVFPITFVYVNPTSLTTTGFTISTNSTLSSQSGIVLYYSVDF